MASLGKELGLDARTAQDTRGRLRDDFEAIDYFENNTTKVNVSTYNIIVDKTYYLGSTFILDHTIYGKLGSGIIQAGSTVSRWSENRIWDLWDENFITTGSKGSETTVPWGTTGSISFYSGSIGDPAILNNLQYWHEMENLTGSASIGPLGTMTGGTLINGKLGSAILFDGTDSITTDLVGSLAGSAGSYMSVAFWFKTNSNSKYICSQWDSNFASYSGSQGWYVFPDTGSKLNVVIYETVGTVTQKNYKTTTNVSDGLWHMAAWTFDGSSDTLKLYLDGSETGSTIVTNDSMSFIRATESPLNIGCIQTADSPSTQFVGSIDDVFVWNRVVSASEISNMWQSGSPAPALATSSYLGSNLQKATLNKLKVTVTGSNFNNLVIQGSCNLGSGTYTTLPNKIWTTVTDIGSAVKWKLTDTTGSSIINSLKCEWRSNDL